MSLWRKFGVGGDCPQRWAAWGWGLLGLLGLLALPGTAAAGSLACTVASVSALSLTYNPASATPLVGSGTITLNCSKSGSNADTRYYEISASLGVNASGAQRRLSSGAGGSSSLLSYGLYRDAALSGTWGDTAGTRLAGTVTSATATSVTVNWWAALPASQVVASGAFTDTVAVTLYQGTQANPALTDTAPISSTLSLTATVVNTCTLSSAPGAVNLTYTSFQTSVASASTGFAVTCTAGAPYTVALDSYSGTLVGLNYQLTLNPATAQVGTGLPQPMSVTATVAAGQSGTCAAASCSASRTHTVTVSY